MGYTVCTMDYGLCAVYTTHYALCSSQCAPQTVCSAACTEQCGPSACPPLTVRRLHSTRWRPIGAAHFRPASRASRMAALSQYWPCCRPYREQSAECSVFSVQRQSFGAACSTAAGRQCVCIIQIGFAPTFAAWLSRETDRQTDGRTDGQTNRQTDRKAEVRRAPGESCWLAGWLAGRLALFVATQSSQSSQQKWPLCLVSLSLERPI